jgi:DNA-binding transcriptional LysR family regulator
MELRQLGHFLAVAEERHFTRAAKRVHLTQSSLSSSIRSLERELGSELFVRSTRQVELTETGRALIPAARRAVVASEEARDAVAAVRGLVRGQLAIGAIQLRELNLPALLARYHRRHPRSPSDYATTALPRWSTERPTESLTSRSSTSHSGRRPAGSKPARSKPNRCCSPSPPTTR